MSQNMLEVYLLVSFDCIKSETYNDSKSSSYSETPSVFKRFTRKTKIRDLKQLERHRRGQRLIQCYLIDCSTRVLSLAFGENEGARRFSLGSVEVLLLLGVVTVLLINQTKPNP